LLELLGLILKLIRKSGKQVLPGGTLKILGEAILRFSFFISGSYMRG